MLVQEIIRRKRDGAAMTGAEIASLVDGLTTGTVSEGQAAAFAMAVFFRGMDREETVALTRAMRDSGTVLDWAALGLDRAPVADKHSTGGIGDKVSLILAPLVAACGASVPMLSGRGLGHTGGTLDKLESIPGYRADGGRDVLVRVVRAVGCAIMGASADLAPADRRLYGIRDMTATVESLPLIVASILSKKLAAGAGALVMDVKVGSGAFMATEGDARALAESLVAVGGGAGLPMVALLTDMDQALGHSVGNALEMAEAIDFLTGRARDPRLADVTLALTAELLVLCGLAPSLPAARAVAQARLEDGRAAEVLGRMVAALGGPADLLERPAAYLAPAPCVAEVAPDREGFVAAIDARALGIAVIELGGGRTRPDQAIDHRVGLSRIAGLGEPVGASRPLCLIHAADTDSLVRAAARVRAAMAIGPAPAARRPAVRARIGMA